jgi:hypothetical protein
MKLLFFALCIFIAAPLPCLNAAEQAAAGESHAHSDAVVTRNSDGTISYNGEYRFLPPPSPPWELLQGNETTQYVFGYYRKDPGPLQLESTFFAYDEEPYGYSRDVEERAREFLKRFYWSSYVNVTVLEKKQTPILGGQGFAVVMEGRDPVKKIKVRSKVIFGKRGERVVAFYINQWRAINGKYDLAAFDIFDKFAESLKFLRKSFYETL